MKKSEFKIKIVNGVNALIDDYFGANTMTDKLINTTLKIIIKQNQNKYDNMLELFADEKGDIDADYIISEYSYMLGEKGFVLDIRDWIDNPTIKNLLPNKALKITQDDIINMFG